LGDKGFFKKNLIGVKNFLGGFIKENLGFLPQNFQIGEFFPKKWDEIPRKKKFFKTPKRFFQKMGPRSPKLKFIG